MNKIPTFTDIAQAHHRIKPFVHETPVFASSNLNLLLGLDIIFKAENLQKVGAFKYRGATNAVLQLSANQLSKGVATHSSGNHAAALALAAKTHGTYAQIVMPENAPDVKKNAVAGYGANITFSKPTQAHREATLDKIIQQTGAAFIHPYDNFNVIAGQGTAAKEFLEQTNRLDILITPVGGGGLLSGSAIAAKSINPAMQVFAAEPYNARDAYLSFATGKLQKAFEPNTIADGLLTSLSPLTLAIIKTYVDQIFTASEETIVQAMRLIWERLKLIVEPSSAVPLAVVMENPLVFRGKKVGIIISGGNVELNKLPF